MSEHLKSNAKPSRLERSPFNGNPHLTLDPGASVCRASNLSTSRSSLHSTDAPTAAHEDRIAPNSPKLKKPMPFLHILIVAKRRHLSLVLTNYRHPVLRFRTIRIQRSIAKEIILMQCQIRVINKCPHCHEANIPPPSRGWQPNYPPNSPIITRP